MIHAGPYKEFSDEQNQTLLVEFKCLDFITQCLRDACVRIPSYADSRSPDDIHSSANTDFSHCDINAHTSPHCDTNSTSA